MADISVQAEMDVGLEGEISVNVDKSLEAVPDCQRKKKSRCRRKRRLGKGPYRKFVPASVRAHQVRQALFANGQPLAPYNTTQFLIEDHGDLQNIDAQLDKAPGQRHGRTRDSSFSVDSDDDYFYSSPEDEEEFLTKEFSLEYQDVHEERLNSMSKTDIIKDYLMLENKYEKAMTELRKLKGEEPGKVTDSGRDTDASSRSDGDVNEQLRLGNVEIRKLRAEVEKLKRENVLLHSVAVRHDSESSLDSESDSSTSSSSVSGSSSGSERSSKKNRPAPVTPKADGEENEEVIVKEEVTTKTASVSPQTSCPTIEKD